MLTKAIKSGKDLRKPYYGSKRFDGSCRNHGGCPWCEASRLRYEKLQRDIAASQDAEEETEGT